MKSVRQWLQIYFGKHTYINRPPDGGFLILMRNKKIILIKEGYHQGKWGLPGGGFILGKNQSIFGASINETHEETGFLPKEPSHVHLLFIASKKRKKRINIFLRCYHYLRGRKGDSVYNFNHFYLCEDFQHDPQWKRNEIEVKEVGEFTFAEIFSPEMNLTDGSRRILTVLYCYLHWGNREFTHFMRCMGSEQLVPPFEFDISEDQPVISMYIPRLDVVIEEECKT